LIVEDKQVLLDPFSKALQLSGFEVLKAANPFDAYYLLEEGKIEILLTELSFGRKTHGAVLAQEVARQWPHICILAVSRSKPLAGELPVQAHFLAKPLSTAELVAEVLSAFDQKTLGRLTLRDARIPATVHFSSF
jgi:DNA-binding NtrC family response regulator